MSEQTSPLEEQLWDRWMKTRSSETADKLMKKYIYLVNFHVSRISTHLPGSVSKDDLKSLGMMGLFDALKKFEPERDLKFDTYASFRIRGMILDGLRKEDWLPRSVRDKAKQVEQAAQALEQSYQRPPSSKEIADYLGMAVQEVEEAVKDSLFSNVLSMEDKPKDGAGDHKEGIGYTLPDNHASTPEQRLIKQEDYVELEAGIRQLNENEQMVISLFYKEELTLTEIGQVLDLTTSRISQIHRKAIFKLKNSLNKLSQ
ncbi:FliA/WhiG family RNA polymerase sigma factor [Sediminibacillus dalangtanensis]|uniref:FliA/WhiG family RNA polymerase sigma factor n=1 Tax=Sediminibacillus dalangtanensis TaxID=2729421 RepID=A0ABX7VS24_9BACI|nr:FliA/WhiG family RNA polymerase sigma factor [Sediminibacillus dalangtanensis]QTM99436.1 FliA/WhiG family RNA polymerase sigma factor [Sediminibacillus dalangtanensis]